MSIINRLLLFILHFEILFLDQAATADRGSSSCGFAYGSLSSYRNDDCKEDDKLIPAVFLSTLAGMVLLISFIVCFRKYYKKRPPPQNASFIDKSLRKDSKQNVYHANLFQSGIWSSRSYRHRKWREPDYFPLTFDPQSMKVIGAGILEVVSFTIDGTYSDKTNRIAFTKKYQANPDEPRAKVPHDMTVQLTWNTKTDQFEGKWYVRTTDHNDEDKFELKYHGQEQPTPHSTLELVKF